MQRSRIVDAVLYGGVLILALAAGTWAIVTSGEDQPAPQVVQPQPEPEPQEELPSFVPDLPTVPDLATEPPPPRPASDEDPRIARLTEEMRFVSRARELLAEDPAQALAILEQHRANYTDGVLREEREAFAIEALIALERRPEAERRYYDFSRVYPSSDFATRLATLMR
jgi:hypothetical protein